jgi:hypothetical protein
LILIDFVPVRLPGGDDANDIAVLTIAVTDEQNARSDAEPKEHNSFFVVRMLGSGLLAHSRRGMPFEGLLTSA